MLIFGGYDRYHLRLENDGYWLGLTPGAETWRPLVAGPPGPIGRTLSSAVYDAAHRRVLVYAGWWNTTQRLDDLWALELSGSPRWQQLAPLGPGPGARFGHAAAYDGLNQRMVLFSGYIGETDWPDDVWALGEVVPPTATWTSTPTASPTPSATGSPTRDTSPGVPTTPVPTVSTPGSATPTAGTATASPTGGTPDRTPATATQPSGSETSTPIRAYLAFLPRAEVPQPVPPHTPTPTYTPTPECATEEIEPNDTAADADTNPSLCPDVTVRGALPGGDADDLYRLEVTRAAGIEVALWNLPHGTDYDLFLYDAAHQKLAESREFDTTDEVIRLRVPAGRYYARVYAQSGRSAQHYWLRWFAEAGGLR
jgi:hypothetical protein